MASRAGLSRSRSGAGYPRCPGGLLFRSHSVSVRVDDNSRWAVGLAGQVERVGDLVEADDCPDAGERIQAPGGDGRQGAVPVLRVWAAAELDGDALTGRIGDAQRIPALPPTGAIDS